MTQSTARTLVIDKRGINYLQWPLAAPNQRLDYYLDAFLAVNNDGDEISSLRISSAPSGSGELSIVSVDMNDGIIKIVTEGGVPGRVYKIKFQVNTLLGRDYCWFANLPIQPNYFAGPFQIAPDPGFGEVDTWATIVLENGEGFWRLENDLGNWVWG